MKSTSGIDGTAVAGGRAEQRPPRFHLVSGLQAGADRGALLGLDDARESAAADAKARLTTGGFAPLGFKCDDYIQASEADPSPEAAASIEAERKWLRGPINGEVADLIARFGVVELPNDAHKVKFKAKDLANVDACDVVVCFRAPVAASGAGAEQTVNYALFGEYAFAEQFKNGEPAGGALQRAALLAQPGWPATHTTQAAPLTHGTWRSAHTALFERGEEYQVLRPFTHRTARDDEASARKGKECFVAAALTQSELVEREWCAQPAARSAVTFTLSESADADTVVGEALAHFLARAAATASAATVAAGEAPLRVMITGPTEAVFAGAQERVRSIFAAAFTALLAAKLPTDVEVAAANPTPASTWRFSDSLSLEQRADVMAMLGSVGGDGGGGAAGSISMATALGYPEAGAPVDTDAPPGLEGWVFSSSLTDEQRAAMEALLLEAKTDEDGQVLEGPLRTGGGGGATAPAGE